MDDSFISTMDKKTFNTHFAGLCKGMNDCFDKIDKLEKDNKDLLNEKQSWLLEKTGLINEIKERDKEKADLTSNANELNLKNIAINQENNDLLKEKGDLEDKIKNQVNEMAELTRKVKLFEKQNKVLKKEKEICINDKTVLQNSLKRIRKLTKPTAARKNKEKKTAPISSGERTPSSNGERRRGKNLNLVYCR